MMIGRVFISTSAKLCSNAGEKLFRCVRMCRPGARSKNSSRKIILLRGINCLTLRSVQVRRLERSW